MSSLVEEDLKIATLLSKETGGSAIIYSISAPMFSEGILDEVSEKFIGIYKNNTLTSDQKCDQELKFLNGYLGKAFVAAKNAYGQEEFLSTSVHKNLYFKRIYSKEFEYIYLSVFCLLGENNDHVTNRLKKIGYFAFKL